MPLTSFSSTISIYMLKALPLRETGEVMGLIQCLVKHEIGQLSHMTILHLTVILLTVDKKVFDPGTVIYYGADP